MKLSDKAQASLQRVLDRFQSGDLSPIVQAVRFQGDPHMPSAEWTLSNRVLAFAQSGSLDCRGFRQWEAVGRKVKKGARAVYILRPMTKRVEEEGEEPRTVVLGFKGIPVFGVEETEGEPLPSYDPPEPPPLLDLAMAMGIDVRFVPVPPDRLGDCTPTGSHIRLGTHDEATFFHELAHAAHVRVKGKLKGEQDGQQETVAELTAAVLMELYGLRDHTGNAWHYIAHYHDDPLTAICQAVREVEQVLGVLLAWAPEPVIAREEAVGTALCFPTQRSR